jgi:hypothetical protein
MDKTQSLPLYVCTRPVQAARIIAVSSPNPVGSRLWTLKLALLDGTIYDQPVTADFMARFNPWPGGYFIRDHKGVASHQDVEEFESNHARVPEPRPLTPEEKAVLGFFGGSHWSVDDIAQIVTRGPATTDPSVMCWAGDPTEGHE